jgi:hypothetical protein
MSFSEPGGLVLPADELSALNNRMQRVARRSYWELLITHSANDPPDRLEVLGDMLHRLWSESQLTAVKNTVLPFAHANDAVKFLQNMDAEERQQWDREIIQAIKGGEWSRIIGHSECPLTSGMFRTNASGQRN